MIGRPALIRGTSGGDVCMPQYKYLDKPRGYQMKRQEAEALRDRLRSEIINRTLEMLRHLFSWVVRHDHREHETPFRRKGEPDVELAKE